MFHKQLGITDAELKFDDQKMSFSGYASVFNSVDAVGDTVLPGAYKNTLDGRQRPIRMRDNHYGPVIGKWVEAREDGKGLFVKGELTPGHSIAADRYASLKHGAIDSLSIGYRVPEGGADRKDGIRYLKQIDLIEISIVEEPAELGAKIQSVKNMAAAIDEIESVKEFERFLREAGGFSKGDAVAITARMKRLALGERDAEGSNLDALVQSLKNISINEG
jgi:HK97 family phage prohead protease